MAAGKAWRGGAQCRLVNPAAPAFPQPHLLQAAALLQLYPYQPVLFSTPNKAELRLLGAVGRNLVVIMVACFPLFITAFWARAEKGGDDNGR